MGVNNGHQIIVKMEHVVARELDLMLDLIEAKYPPDIPTTAIASTKRSIVCDVSNIIHKLSYRHSCIYSTLLVRDVALFLKRLAADTGYIVVPILDGDVRPQSKRDAFKRRFDCTMGRINSFFCRQSAMRIAAKPVGERTQAEKNDLMDYNKEAKRLETSSRLHVPNTFQHDLEMALEEVEAYFADRQSGGLVSRDTVKAEYESDYIMAHQIRNHTASLVYSSDGDMTALCGPTCLCIRNFDEECKRVKKKRKKGEIEAPPIFEYEIVCGSNTLMNMLKEHININSPNSKITYSKAKFPLLEESVPAFLTALYMVRIGCNVLPGGITGVTPLAIWKELEKMEETEQLVSSKRYTDIYNKLISFYLRKDKTKRLNTEYIRTYCQAFLCQPAVEMGSKNDPEAWKYVFFRPEALHPYLKMFAHPSSNIQIEEEESVRDTAAIKTCKEIDGINLPHSFLESEGSFTCVSCSQCFCSTCGYSPQKDRDDKRTKNSLIHYRSMEQDICVDCYKQNIFLPYSCTLEDVLSVEEMKRYLKERNKQLANDIVPHKVQELYELTLVEEQRQTDIDTVPFPTHPVKSLGIKDNKFEFGRLVAKFNIQGGGQFLNLPEIEDEMIAPIIGLFASIVRFDGTNSAAQKEIGYHLPVLDVLPSIFIDLANKSRVSSGFHLLKCCL